MGLTLMAVFLGMQVGVPLDSSSSTWDASTSAGKRHLHHDLLLEDPYVTVITHPCGPWGNWSRFNLAKGGAAAETVESLREQGRSVLRAVNKTVKDRINAHRHVFLEQPYGSQSLDEPEMSDVKKMLDDGKLVMIIVDGCMVGYRDAESKLPHKKPSYYITSMIAAESIFSNCRCDHRHRHEVLEGSNCFGSRTAQASVWPTQLNNLVLMTMIQQAEIEKNAYKNVQEAYPADLQPPRRPRRQRRGRVAILANQFGAPPVYLRPSQLEQPHVQEGPEDQVYDDQPLQDQELREHVAAGLDPILSRPEAQRRQEWLQVDPDLRKVLRTLHVNFGHPTCNTMMRILRRQNAKPEAIRAASQMTCDTCGESITRRRPKPVRLPGRYVFNDHRILLDVFYARDVSSIQFSFLNILDQSTGFQVVSCLGESKGPPASKAVLRHFLTSWSSWAGLPKSIQVDRGREFLASFADYLKQFGVEQEAMPLEAPWKQGQVERAGGLWKQLMTKVVQESQIQGLQDMITATTTATQIRNAHPRAMAMPRTSGYLACPKSGSPDP